MEGNLASPVKTTYTFVQKKNAYRKLGAARKVKSKQNMPSGECEWEVTCNHISLKIFPESPDLRRLEEEPPSTNSAVAEFEPSANAFTADET